MVNVPLLSSIGLPSAASLILIFEDLLKSSTIGIGFQVYASAFSIDSSMTVQVVPLFSEYSILTESTPLDCHVISSDTPDCQTSPPLGDITVSV